MYNLQLALKKEMGVRRGGVAASPMPKSVSFSRKGKRLTMQGLVIAYLFFGGIAQYLSWVIVMTFLVRR